MMAVCAVDRMLTVRAGGRECAGSSSSLSDEEELQSAPSVAADPLSLRSHLNLKLLAVIILRVY